MTKKDILSNPKFEADCARADSEGVAIVGRLMQHGMFVGWSVQGNRTVCYVVRQVGMTLTCNCKATQPCKHRAIVTRRLMEEAAAAATIAQDASTSAQVATLTDAQPSMSRAERHNVSPHFFL